MAYDHCKRRHFGSIVAFPALRPEEAVGSINKTFYAAMSGTGPFLLLLDAAFLIISFGIAMSRYGENKVRRR